MTPAPIPLRPSGNPTLDEIDQAHAGLSPGAQQAISLAGQRMVQNAGLSTPAAPEAIPLVKPRPAGPSGNGAIRLSEPAPSAPTAAPSGAIPISPRLQSARDEVARLTVGPQAKTGIEKLPLPARIPLQILDAIGSGVVPGIAMGIPGTTAHHALKVGQAESAEKQQEAQANEETRRAQEGATTAHTQAETEGMPTEQRLKEAQTAHANAQAEEAKANAAARLHPKPEGHTIETDEGILQFNPDTGKYDIPVGQAPGKHSTQHVMAPDGSVVAIQTDAKTGETKAHVVYTGDPKVETEMADLEVEGKPHKVIVNKKTGQTIKDLGPSGIKPPTQDYGTNFVDPNTGTVVRVRPGQQAPTGGVTTSGFNSLNVPTSQTRSMAEAAPKVLDFTDRIERLINEQEKKLGPASSRFREFVAGKVGASDPEYTKLRTDIGLLQTALMRMHVGSRGGEHIMEHFRDMIDASKQDPDNLRAALGEIKEYAKSIQAHSKGQPENAAPATAEDPKVKAFADQYFGGDIDKAKAEIERQRKK